MSSAIVAPRSLTASRLDVVPPALAGSAATRRPRRRMIDPTTCDRDYGPEELEFMQALDRYKRASGRMFPTCSEVLQVLRSLGYARAAGG
jgi:hypothetical protein